LAAIDFAEPLNTHSPNKLRPLAISGARGYKITVLEARKHREPLVIKISVTKLNNLHNAPAFIAPKGNADLIENG